MTSQRKHGTWPVQDAKARFSELLDATLAEGPQIVTKRGIETAIVVPIDEWRRLHDAAKPSLKMLLVAEAARGDLSTPPRGRRSRRKPSAQP